MMALRALGVFVALGLASSSVVACSADTTSETAGNEEIGEDDVRSQGTTLTFPLVAHEYRGDGNWTTVKLESLNADLQSRGLAPFDKSITVGRAPGDRARFDAIVARVEEAKEKLGRDLEFLQDWDASKYDGLCYTGLISGVRKTVEALRGSAFGEYMGMPGYRYKNTKKFLYGGQTEVEFLAMHTDDNGNEAEVKAWKNFDTASDVFLMLTDGGQQGDGTELFAVSIPKCQP